MSIPPNHHAHFVSESDVLLAWEEDGFESFEGFLDEVVVGDRGRVEGGLSDVSDSGTEDDGETLDERSGTSFVSYTAFLHAPPHCGRFVYSPSPPIPVHSR